MVKIKKVNEPSVIDILCNLEKYEKKCEKKIPLEETRFWYRGESRDYGATKLVASAYRFKSNSARELLSKENRMIEDFYLYTANENIREPETGVEWLTLMQHYKLPTRMLDFTLNKLQAIFFAIYNLKAGLSLNPTIYLLCPYSLNKKSLSQYTVLIADGPKINHMLPKTLRFKDNYRYSPIAGTGVKLSSRDKKRPIAIYTRLTNKRISGQCGTFVLMGEYTGSLATYCLNKNIVFQYKIKIKKSILSDPIKLEQYKKKILQELNDYNVNEFTSFRDLDALSSWIKNKN